MSAISATEGFGSSIAEKWKEEHFPTLAPSTAKGYTASFNRAINRFGMPIKKLTANDVDAMLKQMGKQKYAKKTVANQLLVISLICQSAMINGTIRYNPCTAVKVPAGLKQTPRLLPSDDKLQIVKEGWSKPGGFALLYSLHRLPARRSACAYPQRH